MPITPFSFTDPTLPPEKQTEAQALLRRQAITQQLLGQGVQYPTQPGVRAPALAPFVQALQGLAMSRNLTGTERGLQAIQQQAATGMAGEQEAYRKRFEGTPVETDVADNIVSGVMPDRTGAIKEAMLSKYPLMRQFGEREYTAEAARAQHERDIAQRAAEARQQARTTAELRTQKNIPADWEKYLPPDVKKGPTPGTFIGPDGDVMQIEFENGLPIGARNINPVPRTPPDPNQKQRYQFISTAKGIVAADTWTREAQLVTDPEGKSVLRETADPQLKKDLAAATAAGKEAGEITEQARFNLPEVEAKAGEVVALIDRMIGSEDKKVKRHPGFESTVGWTWTPGMRFVEGSPEADFMSMIGRVTGTAFLEAYSSLRGSGAISEAEGAEAKKAITHLSKSTSEKEFITAARDFQRIIKAGVERARAKAATPAIGGRAPGTPTPKPPARVPGAFEDPEKERRYQEWLKAQEAKEANR